MFDVRRSTFDVSLMSGLYLEDVKAGDRFRSEAYEVTKNSMSEFARQFDPQPFHLDHAAADESVFGGLAASGWHTAAIAMRLLMTGPMQFVGGCIGLGVDELRWPTAVRPGDTIRLETEILEARVSRSKPGHGIIRIRNVATNQKGEVVLSYMANAMVQRRPS
jgi:acyl dehydratase